MFDAEKPISTLQKCWSCNNNTTQEDIFCPVCNKIQTLKRVNYFTLLGLPEEFDLGLKKLEVAYFALQNKLHPDRFVQKTKQEQIFSLQHSMQVNQAYDNLKNPLTRAEYMLQLAGIIVGSDNSSVKPTQEILLENMELRQNLADISSADDLRNFAISIMELKLAAIEDIKQNFADINLAQAAQNTIKLRYLEKLAAEIKAKKL